MAITTKKSEHKALYKVHCTECGDVIENKFFSMKNILECYYYGEAIEAKRAQLIDMLGVGVLYGQTILPKVPPLLEAEETVRSEEYDVFGDESRSYRFTSFRPDDLVWYYSELTPFSCENNEIPDEALKPIELNISSIVAQFYMMSRFAPIYEMLRLLHQKAVLERSVKNLSAEDQKRLDKLCDDFAELPCVRLPKMGQDESRRSTICTVLSYIIEFAEREADNPVVRHFATENISVGWRYKIINDREMPYALAAKGSTGTVYHVTQGCCDKCHGLQACEVGAYRQKLVGILGTQSTGKTTYLTALTDAIDMGELSFMVQDNGEIRESPITVQHSLIDDPQWIRAKQAPAGETAPQGDPEGWIDDAYADEEQGSVESAGEPGPVWLYKNGYPPRKTNVRNLEAPALSFLISDGNQEPVMYTLADIPGEAFTNAATGKFDQLLIQRQHALLYVCDALIMVISNSQLKNAADQKKGANMSQDANLVLNCCKAFMPKKQIPTAVVLTSADEINGGNLRGAMQLAFDLRKLPAMVWSERKKTLVYNAEPMKPANAAVKAYINREFGAFVTNLQQVLQEKSDGKNAIVHAFAVSNGTQCAPYYYGQTEDEKKQPIPPEYFSKEQEVARCAAMRRERFGVTAPLLWMLACDGLLDVGRGDNPFNDYDADVQTKIHKLLKKGLYR